MSSLGLAFKYTLEADPPENSPLNVKKIAKNLPFFQKIAKNFFFFQKKKQNANKKKKKRKFLAIFWQSNGNFLEDQQHTNLWLVLLLLTAASRVALRGGRLESSIRSSVLLSRQSSARVVSKTPESRASTSSTSLPGRVNSWNTSLRNYTDTQNIQCIKITEKHFMHARQNTVL